MVKLQAELQSRQFEIQSLINRHNSSIASEANERIRLASELGQARVLTMARARQLEAAVEASERLQVTLDQTVASESIRYEAKMKEFRSLESEMKAREARWEKEREALLDDLRRIQDDKERALSSTRGFESEASELRSKTLKLEAVIKDQELQV